MSTKIEVDQLEGFTLQDIQNWNNAYSWGNFRDFGLGRDFSTQSEISLTNSAIQKSGFYGINMGSNVGYPFNYGSAILAKKNDSEFMEISTNVGNDDFYLRNNVTGFLKIIHSNNLSNNLVNVGYRVLAHDGNIASSQPNSGGKLWGATNVISGGGFEYGTYFNFGSNDNFYKTIFNVEHLKDGEIAVRVDGDGGIGTWYKLLTTKHFDPTNYTAGVTGLRAGTGNSYIAGDLTILGGTNTTISTNTATKTFTVNGPSTGTLAQLNGTATTIYNWNPSILNQWLTAKGYTSTTVGVNNANYTSGAINFIASGGVTVTKSGNNVTIGGAFDGSSYVNKSTSNIVSTDIFSLDGIGGAFKMTSSGLALIGSDSTDPNSENWDSNFEVSLEERLFRMWSTANGNGFSFSLNDKGFTNIKIPDSEAPFNQKILPLKFTMNGAAYEADLNGVVGLPNSVSNTTFTNNAQNSTAQNQTVTLTNTSYPRVERVFYGGTTNGTLTLNKYAPADGDEIIVQGRQCSIVIKSSTNNSHAIYSADQFDPVYTLRLAEQSFTSVSVIRQFVHLRYMANYQAWVVLSASLR